MYQSTPKNIHLWNMKLNVYFAFKEIKKKLKKIITIKYIIFVQQCLNDIKLCKNNIFFKQ